MQDQKRQARGLRPNLKGSTLQSLEENSGQFVYTNKEKSFSMPIRNKSDTERYWKDESSRQILLQAVR